MKVKNIILHNDGDDFLYEVPYSSKEIIDVPYWVGEFEPLTKGFVEGETKASNRSLFNKNGLAKIELTLGKNEWYLLMLKSGYMLSEVYYEPAELSFDVIVSKKFQCFIYSFYNNTHKQNISITCKQTKDEKGLFNKLINNSSDLLFRQYIIKKMLGKPVEKEIAPIETSEGKKNLTVNEVAEYLNRKVGTIYNWVYKKKIPFHKTGGSLLFRRNEIDEWLVRESRHHKK